MPTEGFNLQLLIREVADASSSPDPLIVAQEVFNKIQMDDRGAALWQALRVTVQHVMARDRHAFRPGNQPLCGTQGAGVAGTPISRKVTQIREHWRKALRDPVSLGTHQWKFLGDCSADDLTYAADLRDRKAVENAMRAQQYRNLAKVVVENKAAKVSDLSDGVLYSMLGGSE